MLRRLYQFLPTCLLTTVLVFGAVTPVSAASKVDTPQEFRALAADMEMTPAELKQAIVYTNAARKAQFEAWAKGVYAQVTHLYVTMALNNAANAGDCKAIAHVIAREFGSYGVVDQAMAILDRESSNPFAGPPTCSPGADNPGSSAIGLFQTMWSIHAHRYDHFVGCSGNPTNAVCNIQVAAEMYRGSGWSPWSPVPPVRYHFPL